MTEKRTRILKAARRVFLQRGFDAATMDEIAQRAGIAKGTLYLYFQDKVDLYAAQIEDRITDLTQTLSAIAAAEKPPIEKLTAIVHANLDYIARQYPGSYFILDTRAGQNPEVLKVIRQRIRPRLVETIGVIARVLQQGIDRRVFRTIDPFTVAAQIFSVVNSNLMIRALGHKLINPKRQTQSIMDLILRGIAVR